MARISRRQFGALSLAATATWRGRAMAAERNILRVAIGGFPLDRGHPFGNIQSPTVITLGAFYDGLTRLNLDGSVAPALAESWSQINADTWRFKLRRDIVFSNGKPFDAAAVDFAVNYLVGPGPANEGARRDISFLAGAKPIDKHTVDIRTTVPIPMLPRCMAVVTMPEPEAWHAMGAQAFAQKPVATGPFLAEAWEAGRAVMRANTTSWRKPAIDGIEFVQIPDMPARVAALQSGQIDVAYALAPEDIPGIEGNGGKIFSTTDGSAVTLIFLFEGKTTPIADARVRRALNLAVNRRGIVDQLLAGKTALSGQPSVREAYGHDPAIVPYPYDPKAAKALLAEAGFPNGFEMTLETSGSGTNALAVVQTIADDLAKVGVRMTVRQKPVIRYLDDFVKGRYDADALTLQWGSYPTLDALFMTGTGSCRKAQPWYCDHAIQPTIEAAWKEGDPEKGLKLRHTIMRYYHDQAPGLFLYENVAFIGLSKRTHGFESVFGWVPFEKVRLS